MPRIMYPCTDITFSGKMMKKLNVLDTVTLCFPGGVEKTMTTAHLINRIVPRPMTREGAEEALNFIFYHGGVFLPTEEGDFDFIPDEASYEALYGKEANQ